MHVLLLLLLRCAPHKWGHARMTLSEKCMVYCAPFLVCACRAAPRSCCRAHSCSLNPTVGNTFSGHAEFELLLEAVSHDKGAQCMGEWVRSSSSCSETWTFPMRKAGTRCGNSVNDLLWPAAANTCMRNPGTALFFQFQLSICCRPLVKPCAQCGLCRGLLGYQEFVCCTSPQQPQKQNWPEGYVVWCVLLQVMLCGRRC
jgi:hypothetical protein